MPHITLQYTHKIEIQNGKEQFFRALHTMLNQIAGIKIEHCKSRIVPITDHLVGDGKINQDFAHVEVRLLEGRSQEIKEKIGIQILELLRKYISNQDNQRMQLSVEIIDMQKGNYFKFPPLS